MSLFWFALIPIFLVVAAGIVFWTAKRLQFFSRKARDLEDVRWDLKELRIEEFEWLVSAEGDDCVNHTWRLSPRQRREACTNRLRVTRDRLHRIICNGRLLQQVARFRIGQIVEAAGDAPVDRDDLAFKIFERATMCHFMAAVCLAKLHFIEFCRIAWPFYLPALAGRFEVRSQNLVAWYQHLFEDVLQLASEDERDWMYGDVLFMLTGLLEINSAEPEEA